MYSYFHFCKAPFIDSFNIQRTLICKCNFHFRYSVIHKPELVPTAGLLAGCRGGGAGLLGAGGIAGLKFCPPEKRIMTGHAQFHYTCQALAYLNCTLIAHCNK